ncbi:MAG: class I SAM-dependent methyltransferase [Halobacteriota archaeon]
MNKLFLPGQKLGYNLTYNNYYSPIPDLRELSNDLWLKRSELVAIDIKEENQIELLSRFTSRYRSEYDTFPRHRTSRPYGYYVDNGAFGSVDGEILYCMVRDFKPNVIIEVGSGNSTYLIAQAIQKNKEKDKEYACSLQAIEPYPNPTLKAGFPGLTRLIDEKVQRVDLSEFDKLCNNDILFIDSSHVAKIGSDVEYEYLEILPRLRKGVIVHFHDIYLPTEYPREDIYIRHLFWNEQYIFHAFLSFNDSFEVLWGGTYMHLNHSGALERAFSSYSKDKQWPTSFWIRKTK